MLSGKTERREIHSMSFYFYFFSLSFLLFLVNSTAILSNYYYSYFLSDVAYSN